MFNAVLPQQAAEIHNLLGMVEVRFAGAGHKGLKPNQYVLPSITVDQSDHNPSRTNVTTHFTIGVEPTPSLGFDLWLGTIFQTMVQVQQRQIQVPGLEIVHLHGLECSLANPIDAIVFVGGAKTFLTAQEAGTVVIGTLIDCLQTNWGFNPSPLTRF